MKPWFELGGLSFPSKTKAEEHIRSILASYGNDQPIEGPHLAFVLKMLDGHERKAVVVGCGIQAVLVEVLKNGDRRFCVLHPDGKRRDFSWRHMLHPPSPLERVRRVCRTLIQPQIDGFRTWEFRDVPVLICPITQLAVQAGSCDIDHAAPDTFVALVDTWLRMWGHKPENIGIMASPEYQVPDVFEDPRLATSWVDYHRTHARLRVVHPTANRSLLRRKPC